MFSKNNRQMLLKRTEKRKLSYSIKKLSIGVASVLVGIYIGMATVFLTNFIRCRTSFRMLFRLSLTMSLLGCDDLRQELTVKVRLPR
ncbi:YSIRK-type signal peptide-containing protein [Enterococcus faecium]|uniref:YSIRK-type signal peptide-containing protein n=1 Tax=Enterococcus faecium TaxID=1352 RepID=UPI00288439EF|nr:YSIRK-type signal peptide-containing protein [Enterococcus faecium]MDT0255708.1 YSIRK-type signal peptide-containing protein [Enterococcus faecium]